MICKINDYILEKVFYCNEFSDHLVPDNIGQIKDYLEISIDGAEHPSVFDIKREILDLAIDSIIFYDEQGNKLESYSDYTDFIYAKRYIEGSNNQIKLYIAKKGN